MADYFSDRRPNGNGAVDARTLAPAGRIVEAPQRSTDLVGFLHTIRRRRVLIAVTTLVGICLGVASAFVGGDSGAATVGVVASRPYYSAETVMTIANSSGGAGSDTAAFNSLQQLELLATGTAMNQRVAKQLGSANPGSRIETIIGAEGDVFTLRAVARSSGAATELADTWATELARYLQEVRIQKASAEAESLTTQLDDLRARQGALDGQLGNPGLSAADRATITAQRDAMINQYRLTYDRYAQLADSNSLASPLSVLERARVSETTRAEYRDVVARAAIGDNHLRESASGEETTPAAGTDNGVNVDGPVARGAIGGLLGLFVGLALAFARDRFDTRLRTRHEIETISGVPVLAEVPELTRSEAKGRTLLSLTAPMSSATEAYRALRSSLLLMRDDLARTRTGNRSMVVMVASARPREGKTITAANLAVVMAETGLSVLAMNCDFRRPVLREYFGRGNSPATVVPSGVEHLDLITNVAPEAGTNPARVVALQRAVIDAARDRYDVVILDTAPLLITNDAVDVVQSSDVVVLVIRNEQTKSEDAHLAIALLERHRARTLGVVANAVGSVHNSYYYYYSRDVAKAAASGPGESSPVGAEAGTVSTGSSSIVWTPPRASTRDPAPR